MTVRNRPYSAVVPSGRGAVDSLLVQKELVVPPGFVDGVTITGTGSIGDPLVAAGSGGGASGIEGDGTAESPFVLSLGAFDPAGTLAVFDDYCVSYGPLTGGIPGVLGVGNTSVLKTGVNNNLSSTRFTCNFGGGPLGPGNGSMMGVANLQLIAAASGDYLTATQLRDANDSGQIIDLTKLQDGFSMAFAARVSFESADVQFEAAQKAWVGFWGQIDTPNVGINARDGAYFHPKHNGTQCNWFCRYRIADDGGFYTDDVDTGIRVSFFPPADVRHGQNLLVYFQPTSDGPTTHNLVWAIDGVTVLSLPLTNPQASFNPMCAIQSVGAGQSNTMYVDWQAWVLAGRPV